MVVKNFESVGMGVMETGMAWFWPDRRVNRWMEASGLEHIREVKAQGLGFILVGIHFLTLEFGARMFGMHNPGIGVYRPNDNPLLDWLQTWGRLRSNKSMLDRKDLKGMVKALKSGELIWYAPDHDYGPRASVLYHYSLSTRLPRPPVPGCWRACLKPVLSPSCLAVNPMEKATN